MPAIVSSDGTNILIDVRQSSLATSFRKTSMLKNVLGGTLEDGVITIPVTNLPEQISLIGSTAEKLGFADELAYAEELRGSLDEARIESENFSEFSEKARAIRDDVHVTDDLESFTRSISDMRRQLKPFQLLSAYHLAFSQNGGNFSVPGAGKTTVVLAAYHHLSKSDDTSRKVDGIVVICPIAAFMAWKDEFESCFGREPRLLEVYGGSQMSKREIQSKLLSSTSDFDLVLVGYQSAASYEKDLEVYLRDHPSMLVLDEAHRIKKVGGGIWAETVLRLSRFARSRVVLTGTPAPNGYVDLKNLFDFMWPARNVIGYSVAQLRDITQDPVPERVGDLMRRIEPYFIRVSKKDLGLPEATFHEPLRVEMDPQQLTLYHAVADRFIPKLIADSAGGIDLSKAKIIRLRQIASNPSLILRSIASDLPADEDGILPYMISEEAERYAKMGEQFLASAEKFGSTSVPPKYAKALELVRTIIDRKEKTIIWCEFVGNIIALGGFLQDAGIRVTYLYGAVPKDAREAIITELHKEHSKYDVVIANPQAVGESISLHQACHNAIYLEMSFNAASYMQSKDRIHRLGLPPGTVTNYYYLVSSGTIDETIFERVLNKERQMLELVEGREIPLLTNNSDFESENEADIKAIIRDYYRQYGK